MDPNEPPGPRPSSDLPEPSPPTEPPQPEPQPQPQPQTQAQPRTLAALWGQPSPSSASTPGQLTFTKDGGQNGKDKEKAPQRKRRKKDDGPAQGRLVFGAEGMSVATPPPPVEDEKKGRKREVGAAKPGRKRGRPPKNALILQAGQADASQPGSQSLPTEPHPATRPRIALSPDSAHVVSDSDSDREVVFTGVTPPASQVQRHHRGTGQANDPVQVDDTPRPAPRRKNIVFASDSKPAHAFFGLRAPAAVSAASELSEASNGATTPAAATSTGSGTATPKAANGGPAKGKVHSFFSNGGRPAQGILKDGWGNCREGDELTAPFPGGEWPNHVGAAEAGPSTMPALHRRARPSPATSDTNDPFWQEVLTRASSPITPSPVTPPSPISAPPFILDHPAIAAVLSDGRTDDGRETWCERHRPRQAGAVLGNELEAEYLRDWLEALSIGQAESRKIIRRVPRRKMANPDVSWIVDDLGLFGEPAEEFGGEEPPDPYEEPYLGPGQRPDSYPPLGAFIGNTIVLTGPSGTGKSAAVHAVATELGWDVFEVYPGIGKRTGPHLTNLVGDVSKNHTVGSRDKKKSAAAAAMAMFAKAKVKPAPAAMGSQGSANDPIELDEDKAPAVAAVAETPAAKTKQSLILIDEADILFDEATTFWPTVVSLIAQSRRPVVITCNDLTSVPTDILPLQVILHFRAAPSYLAQPYLASIAQKHGFSCDITRLFQDCTRPCLPNLVEQPLPPNGNEPEERFDLRAALMQMQLDRQSSCERRRHGGGLHSIGLVDIGALSRQLDAESYGDAFVASRPWARLEISEGDRFEPTSDDQDGIRLVCKPDVQDVYPELAPYGAADEMAAALVKCSGGGMPRNPRQLQYDQTLYIRGLLPFLDPLIPLSARLLPHPSLFLDVVPTMRSIVLADDAFEMADRVAAANGEARVNPRTGRAMRTQGYERWLDLGFEERAAAVEAGLVYVGA